MRNPFEDAPECGFCNIKIDEEEEGLEPIYVGELPDMKEYQYRDVGRVSSNHRFDGDARKHTAYSILYKIAHESDIMDVELHNEVRTFEAVGGDVHIEPRKSMPIHGEVEINSTIDDDRVGATLHITPEREEVEPDAMVCGDCAEMFKNL